MSGPRFRSEAVRVRVPATSANLGPGFDSFGLAVGVFDEHVAMVSEDEGVLVEVVGEGEGTLPRDESHLVVRAMRAVFDLVGEAPAGFVLKCSNTIPHGRGLGSSASAIVGGLVLARGLVVDGERLIDDQTLLDVAATMEGHPDNVAAALLGGFTMSWVDAGVDGATGDYAEHAQALRLTPHPDVVVVVAVPPEPVPTAQARAVLPDRVPFADASFNVGRAALLVHALTVDPGLLMLGTDDRLHQDARRAVYPRTHDLMVRLRAAGVPAVVSGAGPTVLALASAATAGLVADHAEPDWVVRTLPIATDGARVVRPEADR